MRKRTDKPNARMLYQNRRISFESESYAFLGLELSKRNARQWYFHQHDSLWLQLAR